MRSYKTTPQIWDGDPHCEHEWNEYIEKPKGGLGSVHANVGANKNDEANRRDKPTITNFCSKCNAWKGELGLEPDFQMYISHLIQIFAEVKRVLRKDGCCFINLGDTYFGSGIGQDKSMSNGKYVLENFKNIADALNCRDTSFDYKQKCLCLIPQRFAIEMVNRGWILRNFLIWKKENAMPCSASDRFTIDYEPILFFVKNKDYYFEQQFEPHKLDSIKRACRARESAKLDSGQYSTSYKQKYVGYDRMMERLEAGEIRGVGSQGRNMRTTWSFSDVPYSVQPRVKDFVEYRELPNLEEFSVYLNDFRKQKVFTIDEIEQNFKSQSPHHWFNGESFPSKEDYLKLKDMLNLDDKYDKQMTEILIKSSEKTTSELGRNMRTTWEINTRPFSDAHFAVFPVELPERCIKAGCPEFVCNKCGKVREKIIEKGKSLWEQNKDIPSKKQYSFKNDNYKKGGDLYLKNKLKNPDKFVGYSDCGCNAGFSSGIILDPFMGAGTTALAALRLNRRFCGIELNPEYIKIAEKRIKPYLEQTKLSNNL